MSKESNPPNSAPVYVRLPRVLRDYIPVAKSTLYQGVAEGRYPAPHRIGKRAVAWRVADLERYLADAVTTSKEAA